MQATRNPWSLEHVPGGSSGGSAAAVAAGQCIAALGSDTGAAISLAFGVALPGLLGEQGLRGIHVQGASRLQEAVTNLIAWLWFLETPHVMQNRKLEVTV